jgi:hypothetical protein
VWLDGELAACPDPYGVTRYVFETFEDNRTCGCTCSGSCTGTFRVYGDAACEGTPTVYPANGSCQSIATGSNLMVASVQATCVPSVPAVGGEVEAVGAVTLCCRAPQIGR